MSASVKRHASSTDSEIQSKLPHREALHDNLRSFIDWAMVKGFELNDKVTVRREGSCAQYGMLAVDNIGEGEVLFQIPRNMLLHPGTTAIQTLLEEGISSLESKSGWVPLLVSLMFEYNNPASLWRPYLDLVPDFKELDLPMFWSSTERENLLSGTGVPESVSRDLKNLETEFSEVVQPFISKHMDKFSPVCKELEFYKKMVAFVMAYSFTEPMKKKSEDADNQLSDDDSDDEEEVMSPPMMVPMADILNHVAKNNARLTFETDALKMVAVKNIKKGEEVFNTYGELSNSHLLHMYGFAEQYPNNHFDEVTRTYIKACMGLNFKQNQYKTVELTALECLENLHIDLQWEVGLSGSTLMQAAKHLECNSDDIFNRKKTVLQDMGLIDTTFVVGTDGILTEDEIDQALKIWTMPADVFNEFVENDEWIEEDEDKSFLFDNGIEKLPRDMKQLLHRCAMESFERYKTQLKEDESTLNKDPLSNRQRYSLFVNYGQKKILQKLVDCLS